MYGQRAGDKRLFIFFFIFPTGWYRVCEIEFSHMGKNSRNLDLVCKKIKSHISCSLAWENFFDTTGFGNVEAAYCF